MFGDMAEFVIIILFGMVIIFLLALIYIIQGKMSRMVAEVNNLSTAVYSNSTEIEELSRNVETSIKLTMAQHVKNEFETVQKNIKSE